MQLSEVKNNIIKVLYSTAQNNLLPSDFLLIEDVNQKIIAQIIRIETTDDNESNLAVLRPALSIDKDDNLSLYNGYLPSKNANVLYINPEEIMELIKGNGSSIFFGELANHSSCYVKPSINILNDKLYIRSDRYDKISTIVQNLCVELANKHQKAIVIDTQGKYSNIKDASVLRVSQEIKLPLNSDAFNNIWENDTNDCSVDDKAVIQSIILEVREYVQTLKSKSIAFSLFKSVVDEQCSETPSSGLMIFRNKLWKYAQDNIFADDNNCESILNNAVNDSNIVVIDLSLISETWCKYALNAILNMIENKCYVLIHSDDFSSDKKFITGLYNKTNIIPVVSTSYNSNSSQLLKSICSNYLMCKPSKYIDEGEVYTDFLNRINSNEIILFGDATLNLPIIAELKQLDLKLSQSIVENEIKKDVDNLLSPPKPVISPSTTVDITDDKETIIEDNDFNEEIIEEDIIAEDNDSIINEILPIEEYIENIDDNSSFDDIIQNEQSNDNEEFEFLDSDLDFLDEISAQETTNTDLDEGSKYDIFEPNDVVISNEQDPDILEEFESTENLDLNNENSDENQGQSLIDDVVDNIDEPEQKMETDIIIDAEQTEEPYEEIINEDSEPIELNDGTDIDLGIDSDSNSDSAEVETIVENKFEESNNDSFDEIIDETQNEQEEIQNEPEEISSTVEPVKEEEDETSKEDEVDMASIDDVIQNITDKMESGEGNNLSDNKVEENHSSVIDELFGESTDDENLVQNDEKNIEPEPPKIKENINTNKKQDLPIYETDVSTPLGIDDLPFKTGDTVYHPKHGKGVIEGFTNYSNKILFCQIDFENVGRRILDPRIAGIEKVE